MIILDNFSQFLYHWIKKIIIYQSRYKLYYFNFTMSPFYVVKLKLAQKQPTANCSAFC